MLDLVGQEYDRLIVLRRLPQSLLWECECKCGNIISVSTLHLRRRSVKSCGCLRKELMAKLGRSRKKDHDIHEMKMLRRKGFTLKVIGKFYNLSPQRIHQLLG